MTLESESTTLAPGEAPEPRARAVIPRATYRVQLHAGFTFDDARGIVPYLAELGVGALYASPLFTARPGSLHGYDVTDYGVLNPELGTKEDFDRLVAALQRHNLGLIVDSVPNHMGIGQGANAWWRDVLENGQTSPFAASFDIDWRPLKPELRGKVLLPILGDHYGVVLERGELTLGERDGAFGVAYYDAELPIAPPTYPTILAAALPDLEAALAPDDPALLEFQSIMTAFARLAPADERDPDLIAERMREQIVAKRRLATLLAAAPLVRAALDAAISRFNGVPGEPRSFDALDALLGEQVYRLSSFRTAAEEINYRRFFAINDLAAIRQEEPAVFAATHEALLSLIGSGAVTGVRIDHPDGLWDPAGYMRQLQASAAAALAGAPDPEWTAQPASLAADGDRDALPLYLVVEKILEPGEELPDDWAVQGTVGYEFARVATGLFVDAANRKAFDDLYARYIGGKIDFADLVYRSKQLMMRVALASETNVLAQALNRISEQDRRTRDFTLNALRDALRDVIASFPVYRTYVVCGETPVSDRDRRYIEAAVAQAKRRNPASDPGVFDFLRDVLLLEPGDGLGDAEQAERCRFAMKFQQLTGPVMAKGLEDTAFYIYNRLISLNEVGSDPAIFGIGSDLFHRHNASRRRRWPHELLASSTHDTKRSEDVRARIDVLSELPREWRAALNRWTRLNRRHRGRVDGASAPARNDEYLFYQTLLGAWPFDAERPDAEFVDRIDAFMLKAVREAQVHTSWINPNDAYEMALHAFVRGVLGEGQDAFFDDFAGLRQIVAHVGAFNALSQQLLKLASPGVPDIYQGTELWDFSLVDPDNRRPVDYAARARLLNDLRSCEPSPALAAELVAAKADGRIKLYLTDRALACRASAPELFRDSDYRPLSATGARQERVVAFARRLDEREIIVAVPRLVASLARGGDAPVGEAVWGADMLMLPSADEDARYRNVFTGEIVAARAAPEGVALRLADLFAVFPTALLEQIDARADGESAAETPS